MILRPCKLTNNLLETIFSVPCNFITESPKKRILNFLSAFFFFFFLIGLVWLLALPSDLTKWWKSVNFLWGLADLQCPTVKSLSQCSHDWSWQAGASLLVLLSDFRRWCLLWFSAFFCDSVVWPLGACWTHNHCRLPSSIWELETNCGSCRQGRLCFCSLVLILLLSCLTNFSPTVGCAAADKLWLKLFLN